MSREKGLFQKYKVTKVSNPKKKMDCIVLEFDDPLARKAIRYWAKEAGKKGYFRLAADVLTKLDNIEENLK